MHPARAMDGERLDNGRRLVDASPADHEEVEWQFDAPALEAVARWLTAGLPDVGLEVGTPDLVTIHDSYLDTNDRRLHRAGYALRVRRDGRALEATLKALAPAEEGVSRRREITEPAGEASPEAVCALPGPVGARVRAVAGRRALTTLFDVRTRRRRFALRRDGDDVAEVALDATTFIAPHRMKSPVLTRVEVEVEPAAIARVTPFVDALRRTWQLTPATGSKYEIGLAASGLEAPAPPDFGPTAIDPGMSIGAAAFAVLRAQLVRIVACEPGTRLGEDIEALHDMRVAARRLRVAMKLFAAALPARAGRLRDELGKVGDALGAVRDLDVHLAEVERWGTRVAPADAAALQPLLVELRRRRARAQRRMLRVLDGRRYERVIAAMARMLTHEPARRPPPARQAILAGAPDLIRKRYGTMRKRGDAITQEAPGDEYHQLRIAAKRLRYAIEFCQALYDKPGRALASEIVELQDALGLHQDAQIIGGELRELCETQGRRLPPSTVFMVGQFTQWYVERAAEVRAAFPKLWARVRGKRWKRLRRAMDARRPAPPVARGA